MSRNDLKTWLTIGAGLGPIVKPFLAWMADATGSAIWRRLRPDDEKAKPGPSLTQTIAITVNAGPPSEPARPDVPQTAIAKMVSPAELTSGRRRVHEFDNAALVDQVAGQAADQVANILVSHDPQRLVRLLTAEISNAELALRAIKDAPQEVRAHVTTIIRSTYQYAEALLAGPQTDRGEPTIDAQTNEITAAAAKDPIKTALRQIHSYIEEMRSYSQPPAASG